MMSRSKQTTSYDNRVARYFDSENGRFLSVDPLAGDFPASSMYEYALGNPVFYTDPDGQAANQYTFNVETGEFKQINDIGGDEDHTIFTIYGSDDEGYFDYSDPINFSGTPPAFAYSFSGGALFTSIPLRELLIKGGSNTMGQLYNSKILNRNEAMAMMDARVRSSGEAFIKEPMGAVFMGVVYEALLMGFTHGLTGTRSFSNYGLDFAAKGSTTVYTSVSKGVTQYVGITNNVARRSAEHLTSKGINIQPLMRGLSRTDSRTVEQALIEIHGLGKNGGTLLNRINSISPKNPAYGSQLQRGYDLLKSIGY